MQVYQLKIINFWFCKKSLISKKSTWPSSVISNLNIQNTVDFSNLKKPRKLLISSQTSGLFRSNLKQKKFSTFHKKKTWKKWTLSQVWKSLRRWWKIIMKLRKTLFFQFFKGSFNPSHRFSRVKYYKDTSKLLPLLQTFNQSPHWGNFNNRK